MGQSASTSSHKETGKRLLAAAKIGDAQEVAAVCCALHSDPLLLLYANYQGCNVVHYAAQHGRLEVLKLLIGIIRQHAAALSARLESMLQLEGQSKESSVAARIKQLHQPRLPWCSRSQAVHLFSREKVLPTLLSWRNHKGVTPLMLAARAGHAQCLALLLSEGADPLALDKVARRSCLHYAATAGQAGCVNVLLNEFRTVQQPYSNSSDSSSSDSSSGTRQVLLQSALLRDGCTGVCRFVDIRTTSGFSALHYASYWGNGQVVGALLTAGADVLWPTANTSTTAPCELMACAGSTPLHLAAGNGHRYIVAMILQAHWSNMSRQLRAPRLSDSGSLGVQAAWEGVASMDPRAVRNTMGSTPMHIADMQLNSSDLVLMLDPSVPLQYMLQAGGAANRFRFGVTKLEAMAKSVLDKHLADCLDTLEAAQHTERQKLAAARSSLPTATTAGNHVAFEPAPADNGFNSGANWHAGSSMLAAAAAAAAAAATASAEGASPAAASLLGLQGIEEVDELEHEDNEDNAEIEEDGETEGCISRTSSSMVPLDQHCWLPEGQEHALKAGEPAGGQAGLLLAQTSLACPTEQQEGGSGPACFAGDYDLLQPPGACGTDGGGGLDGGEGSEGDEILQGDVDDDSGDEVCSICFDAASNVQLAGCDHLLCVSCARAVIKAAQGPLPAACPYCRQGISGFVALGLKHT